MRTAAALLAFPPLLVAYILVVALAMDTERQLTQYLIMVPLVYVLGSVPWGFLIMRVLHGVDVRQHGSGRIGASNVLRTGGLKTAAAVFTLDLSKGALALLLARVVVDTPAADVTAGLLVLAGHNWSVFLGFRGGRGIMPAAGAVLIFLPIANAIGLAAWIVTGYLSRYVSLASLAAVTAIVATAGVLTAMDRLSPVYMVYMGVGGTVIFWQHADNIKRLFRGTERRLGDRTPRASEGG